MSVTVFDWAAEEGGSPVPTRETIEPDVPEIEERPDPLTAETDPTWDAPCPLHRAWMWERRHAMPPVRPPRSSCPYCADAALRTPEAPSSISEFERDPAASLNRAAPRRVADEWQRRESRRRVAERAMLDRRAELDELISIIESDPTPDYIPSPIRQDLEPLISPHRRKAHTLKVKRAKARRDHLLSTPIDIGTEVQYHGRDIWDV